MFEKLVIAMSGLPGRGKSAIAQKLAHYLNWQGYKTAFFNVGSYRRQHTTREDYTFFSSDNLLNLKLREGFAIKALEDMLEWLKKPESDVGIHDATNTTKERRKALSDRCREAGVQFIMIESILTDEELIEMNLHTKLKSPDYERWENREAALDDLRSRIRTYELTHQTIEDDENLPYIKMINFSDKVIVHKIHGYLASQIVFYLMNIHSVPRPIWLTRHGESEWNHCGKIGGDPGLSEKGLLYAQRLSEHFTKELENYPTICVWTSTLKRTIQTVQFMQLSHRQWPALNEIDAGDCEGLTYEEIKEKMPDVHAGRNKDKLGFRYPGGESYLDVIERLKPIICELERQRTPVLVVAHQAIVRTILSYFIGKPIEELPHVEVPLQTIFKLTPTLYGYEHSQCELSLEPGS